MRNLPRCSKFLSCAAPVLLLAAGAPAHAMPVTYTLSGLFSGSLNGISFSNAQGLFSLSGSDTSQVTTPDNVFFFNTDGQGTFQLGSAAPVTIASKTFGVESETNAAGFQDLAAGFDASEYNELTPYDVLTNFGSNTGFFESYGPQAEQTSGGALVLTGASGPVTFTAGPPAAAVTPEPASLALTATGLLGMAGMLRRRMQMRGRV